MNRVCKYEFPITDLFAIVMPKGAEVLCVQTQYGVPRMWARVDDLQPSAEYYFRLVGTGHAMPPETGKYIGTIQLQGGELVFHVFEEKK